MHTARKVLKNTGYLTLGQVTTIALGIAWIAFFARYIGPQGMGRYTYAQSILAILVIFVEFGLQNLVIRSVAQDRNLVGKYFVATLTIKLTLSFLIYGLFSVFLYLHGWDAQLKQIMAVVALTTFIQAIIGATTTLFYAYERMEFDAVGQIMRAFFALGLGLLAIHLGFSLVEILLVLLTTSILRLIWNAFFLLRLIELPCLRAETWFDWRFNWHLLKRSIPFAVLGMIGIVYTNILVIVLRLFVNDTYLGYFSAAQRIYTVIFIVPSMFMSAVFPALSSSLAQSMEKMAQIYQKAYRYLFAVSAPMAIGIILAAKPIMLLVFGKQFLPGVIVLQILALGLLNGVGYLNAPALLAMGKEWFNALIFGVALVLVAVLCFILVPRFGMAGGSWAVVFGNLCGFAVYSTVLFKWLKLQYPFRWVVKVLGASGTMGLVVYLLLPHVNFLFTSFIIAPSIYLGLLLILRTFDKEDFRTLRDLVPEELWRVVASR